MAKWTPFPEANDYEFDVARVKKSWARLHQGDAETLPNEPELLQAWALYHSGQFQLATLAGLKAGGAGMVVANKATCIYATYLEKKEKTRLDLFLEVAKRADAQLSENPQCASAHYWQAYAMGRYSQGISVAKALAQGLGGKIKSSLETTIKLQPKHADAHVALGAFHAEVIDKVGSLIGGMTYGAKKETGLKLFQDALKLTPGSPIAMVEYANALVMLEGDKKLPDATRLYEQAAAVKPLDAMEYLVVEMARTDLHDA
jgi:tetratricopeptide (TPR) repeat protein